MKIKVELPEGICVIKTKKDLVAYYNTKYSLWLWNKWCCGFDYIEQSTASIDDIWEEIKDGGLVVAQK